jgi:hypothetical protein
MQSPPPYTPPGKKSNTGLIIGLVIGGILLCCVLPIGLIGGGGFLAFNKGKDMITCGFGIRQMRDAVIDYANANNGKLPDADRWMDQVRPYYEKQTAKMKEDNPFGHIPADSVWACTSDGVQSGIAFNSALSGKNLKSITDRSNTIVVFEVGTPAKNKHEPYKDQSKATSPKMFGKPRGWFKAALEGPVRMGDSNFEGNQSGVRIKSDVKAD